ncbi:MAG: hypothetical protein JXR63_07495 [Spirochaetales bacterium]|nr:hypothetical protein [Spirochaetales bacterium]
MRSMRNRTYPIAKIIISFIDIETLQLCKDLQYLKAMGLVLRTNPQQNIPS